MSLNVLNVPPPLPLRQVSGPKVFEFCTVLTSAASYQADCLHLSKCFGGAEGFGGRVVCAAVFLLSWRAGTEVDVADAVVRSQRCRSELSSADAIVLLPLLLSVNVCVWLEFSTVGMGVCRAELYQFAVFSLVAAGWLSLKL